MKPKLVDHMFQRKSFIDPPKPVVIQKPVVKQIIYEPVVKQIIYEPVDYKPFLIHLFGILCMIFGGCFLYYRKITKEENKQSHIQKIKDLEKTLEEPNLKKEILNNSIPETIKLK